ncbi:cytochrome P450 CYP82D47-like [Cucumis melo var. makuwa]|uniref:Cytochrome P450 CYP82D47-like n=1 Tax=Cucumis melo var. makuwa TaxID=1194695 RepID=A0A5D3DT76_CUCMM|nr:cytochrome P450 CYP82D47-like [Cucumis melo var. makuwa]TYK26460.1 cytochrome P450 CYP82D47-like [Cucumis melo var. makuwa]
MGMNNCHIKPKQATKNDNDEPRTMSSFLSSFDEIDAMFLEFVEDLNNTMEGWTDIGREYIEFIKGDLQSSETTITSTSKSTVPLLVERMEDWHFLNEHNMSHALQSSNHGQTRLLDRSNLTIIAAGRSRFYNDSTSSLSNENQRLELQSQPTLESSQPLLRDKICEMVLDRRLGYSKGLGWGPKPKSRMTTNASSASTSCS